MPISPYGWYLDRFGNLLCNWFNYPANYVKCPPGVMDVIYGVKMDVDAYLPPPPPHG